MTAFQHEGKLLCGLATSEKNVEKKFIFTEITGSVRRVFGNPEILRRPDLLMKKVVEGCLRFIGDKPVDSAVVDYLDVADRDYIFMQICKASTGSSKTLEVKCEDCSAEMKHTVDLNEDIEFYSLPTPDDPNCNYEIIKTGSHLYSYRKIWQAENKELNISFKMKYDIVKESTARANRKNIIESIDEMFGDLLYEWTENGDLIKGPVPHTFWDGRPKRVLDWREEVYEINSPGLISTIKITCPSCAHENAYRMTALDFLSRPEMTLQRSGLIRTKQSGLLV